MSPPQTPDVCVIMVMFPCEDDAVAFEVKTKINTILESIPDARVDFRIGPPRPAMPTHPGINNT